ncbi:MAG: hypothetical protein CL677_09725 [Bdellovibrionaceae bacterium]|nr:hypothetical protein [Pseudobdellovibrionaceae bacterium]|tara:strand:- start:55858 stop:56322 length:465 start_codon:yes stop_codon:yes gene_type:complete
MKLSKLFVTLAALSLSALAQATSLHPDTYNSTILTGQFDMLSQPEFMHRPGGCDVGQKLVLTNTDRVGPLALIKNHVYGLCEVYANPDERYVELQIGQAGCGSKLYTGSHAGPDGTINIEIIDHRTRLCRDLVPAAVIMNITYPNREAETLYAQ